MVVIVYVRPLCALSFVLVGFHACRLALNTERQKCCLLSRQCQIKATVGHPDIP